MMMFDGDGKRKMTILPTSLFYLEIPTSSNYGYDYLGVVQEDDTEYI